MLGNEFSIDLDQFIEAHVRPAIAVLLANAQVDALKEYVFKMEISDK